MKPKNVDLWMLAFIVSMLVALVTMATAFGETISEHDRQDMALQKAIQLCQQQKGEFSWSMPKRYQLTTDAQGYRIIGNELLVVCKVTQASGPPKWKLSWQAPTTRSDGTPLQASEIAGYQVALDGTLLAMVPGTEYLTDPLESIDKITLRTVDTGGRVSAPVGVVNAQ